MSDLTPDLQEMAARADVTEMLMPHEIRRAGERRRMWLAMTTATCVVTLMAVAAGLVVKVISQDAASVEPSGRLSPNPTATISMQMLAGPGRPGDLPSGTYRYTLTLQELLAHGVAPEDAQTRAGVWTWTLGHGRWSYRIQQSEQLPACWNKYSGTHRFRYHSHALEGCHLQYAGDHCAGYYDVVGHHVEFSTVTVYPNGQCAPPIWFASWSREGDGLHMPPHIPYGDGYLFGGKRWDRVSGSS